MDYLKSKVVQAEASSSSEGEEEEDSEDEVVNCEEGSEAEGGASSAAPAQQESVSQGAGPDRGALPGSRRPQDTTAEVCVHREGWREEGRRAGPACAADVLQTLASHLLAGRAL
jgi:hypothetical protein